MEKEKLVLPASEFEAFGEIGKIDNHVVLKIANELYYQRHSILEMGWSNTAQFSNQLKDGQFSMIRTSPANQGNFYAVNKNYKR